MKYEYFSDIAGDELLKIDLVKIRYDTKNGLDRRKREHEVLLDVKLADSKYEKVSFRRVVKIKKSRDARMDIAKIQLLLMEVAPIITKNRFLEVQEYYEKT